MSKASASDMEFKEEASTAALASISVSTKLPEFWTDLPRLWFAQFESVMAPQKQGEETKFNLVISKLGKEAIQQVSDLVMSPPAQDKYTALKERLLQVYEESAERQMQKLVSELELGSQRPSQFLRRMKDLGRSAQISDNTLKSLWLSKMPSSVRAVMAVCEDQSLDKLAAMADKITEYTNVGDVAAVSCKKAADGQPDEQMSRLELEVAALRAELRSRGCSRRNDRPTDFRRRSTSRPRRVPGDPDWLCRFHFRYRSRASRCEQPCAWRAKQSGN
ncbi:uncharacterized protein LOC121730842 [Aricia agestis]|uniref:uncharacterized protein LOC121730842 n=1 Tax=Aricia agestis TaxID=91739 RepID=UPI001C205CF2|nr:uncharacterized protein LOC121730842 [Aricia agestis]